MNLIQYTATLVLLGLMAGCAKMPGRGEYVEVTNPPEITPNEQVGAVCFMRESSFVGGGISYYIWEDSNKIGMLRSGSYFCHPAALGKHTYWAETEAKAFVTVDVDAATTKYVVGGLTMGMWAGRPQLTEVTKDAAAIIQNDNNLKYTRLRTDEEYSQWKREQEALEKKSKE